MRSIIKLTVRLFITGVLLTGCNNAMQQEVGEGCIADIKKEIKATESWSSEKQEYIARNLEIEFRLTNLAREARLKEVQMPSYAQRAAELAKAYDAEQERFASKTKDQELLSDMSGNDTREGR